ncbi:Coiled-coil domain-containing protein 187 [Galemys pyrenaicus]|uniref:Coiled-coil domain-containing protein 187 n=1 Tax=Galemys pyrenaicus TaxID=202257 RepID=A0A8J6ACT7_GALPY|nr:Coiled-coil domain-containing protein 187 [Galemys pyrenaicus]
MAELRRPGPCPQLGAPRGPLQEAWPDCSEEPVVPGKTRGLPMWSSCEEAGDRASSVSSGRLSGSSGGHESSSPAHARWREQPAQTRGPRRQPRESSPWLEQLRAKIRAQAGAQASCASLGTSPPCRASPLGRASRPGPQRKARKPAVAPAAPASPGQWWLAGSGWWGRAGSAGGHSWAGARPGLPPQEELTH